MLTNVVDWNCRMLALLGKFEKKERGRCKWGLQQAYFEVTLWYRSYSSLRLRMHSSLSLALSNEAPKCKWACPCSLFPLFVFWVEYRENGHSNLVEMLQHKHPEDNVCMEGTVHMESCLLYLVTKEREAAYSSKQTRPVFWADI